MALSSQPQWQKFKPKTVKFSELYKHCTKFSELSEAAKKKIHAALSEAGFNHDKASQIIGSDQATTPSQLKQLIRPLSRKGVAGFVGRAETVVDKYLKVQAIKQRNLNRAVHENVMAARRENLNAKPQSSALATQKINLPY